MSMESDTKRYMWRVKGLSKCFERWEEQLNQLVTEIEQYNTDDDWDIFEKNGEGLRTLMNEIIELSIKVDPLDTHFWCEQKEWIINTRIRIYQMVRRLDGPLANPPLPTPEEEATAQVEKREMYRICGINLPKEDGCDKGRA